VLTDTSGNVYRRGASGGWEQRQAGSWQPSAGTGTGAAARPSTRPSTRPSQPSSSNLNRDYSARSRGQVRSQQYRSTARMGGGAASRGGARPRRR
jgi:hypothetical protein